MHFMAQRISTPIAYQTSAGVALASAGASLLAAVQQFRKTSDLSATWTGTSAQAHEQRVTKLIDAATRVAQAIARAQTVTAPGAARMQALKTQNDATVASAIAGRFVVLPSGQVVPGPEHYASAVGPHAAAIMKMYWTIAKLYTGQVNANVATSTATDGQTAVQLAAIAVQFFADLLQKKKGSGTDPALAMPPGGLPGGSAPLDPFTIPPEPAPILDPNTGGTSLAGAGGLGGAGSFPGGIPPTFGGPGMPGGGLGGVGGGLGGVGGGIGGGLPGGGGGAGLGGAGMVGGVPMGGAMAGGAGAGGAGVGRGGAAGGAMLGGRGGAMAGGATAGGAGGAGGAGAGGAGAGRSGAAGGAGAAGRGGGMTPMAGGMGYGSGQDEEHASSDTWLKEDGNPFDPGEAPGSVLT